MKQSILHSEKGFALIAAILMSLILLAVGMLVISLSTGDLRSSVRVVCDKRALSATETGIQRLMKSFDATRPDLSDYAVTNIQADPADPTQRFTTSTPVKTKKNNQTMPGFPIDERWVRVQYDVTITGTNTACNSTAVVTAGLVYGPVKE